MDFENLPKGMSLPETPEPTQYTPAGSARSVDWNILKEIREALTGLPFDVVVDDALLHESDSSNETAVQLTLHIFKKS